MHPKTLPTSAAERFAPLLDIADDAIIGVDGSSRIMLFNRGAERIFGYPAEEVLGQKLEMLMPARSAEGHQKHMDAFAASPKPARLMGERSEVLGRRKDGSEFPAEASITKLPDGESGVMFTAILRDVSRQRKAQEAQLVESRARLHAIIYSALSGIITLDGNLRVTLFNPAAEEIFQCSPDEAMGREIEDFIPGGLPPEGASAVSIGPPIHPAGHEEVLGRRSTGELFPLDAALTKLVVNGQVVFALILSDITQRKRAEQALRETNERLERTTAELRKKTAELQNSTQQLLQAAKLASVGELAASIAHELNNPLGTVSLRLDSLLANTPQDDPRRRPLEVVEQETERMAGLVGNLLHFSRPSGDQVSTVDVSEEAVKTMELTQHHLRRRGVEVNVEFDPALPTILADRQKLRQVFLNLYTNAGDAMPQGGRLITRGERLNFRTAEKPFPLKWKTRGTAFRRNNCRASWILSSARRKKAKARGWAWRSAGGSCKNTTALSTLRARSAKEQQSGSCCPSVALRTCKACDSARRARRAEHRKVPGDTTIVCYPAPYGARLARLRTRNEYVQTKTCPFADRRR